MGPVGEAHADRSEIRPGRFGRWTLEAPIGAGGFGVTWRARGHDGSAVAVKILDAEPGTELLALARVVHPAVVGLVDAGSEPAPHIVMSLVEGRPLSQVSLGAEDAVAVVAVLADGLAAAHAAGVTHGDIKPDNVLLTSGGQPCLVDFGASASRACTPAWAAPERLQGVPASESADVYSLGLLAFSLIRGQHPFYHRPRPRGTRAPALEGAPGWLAALVAEMLSEDPMARPRAATIADRAEDAGCVMPRPTPTLLTRRARRLYVPRVGERERLRTWHREGGALEIVGDRGMGRTTVLRQCELWARSSGRSVAWVSPEAPLPDADILLADDTHTWTPAAQDALAAHPGPVAWATDRPTERALTVRVSLVPLGRSSVHDLLVEWLGVGTPGILSVVVLREVGGAPARIVSWVLDALQDGVLAWRSRRWVFDRVALDQRAFRDLEARLEREGVAHDPEALLRLATSARDLGRSEDAVRAAQQAWDHGDDNVRSRAAELLARLHAARRRNPEDATAWASRITSDSLSARATRATVWFAEGDVDAVRTAADLDPTEPPLDRPADLEPWLDLQTLAAQALQARRGPPAAVARLRSVPEGVGLGTAARARLDAELARQLVLAGSLDEALRWFDRATSEETLLPAVDRAKLLNNSAVARDMIGDRPGALARWQEAHLIFERLEAEPWSRHVQVNLTLAWLRVARPTLAEEVGRAAVQGARDAGDPGLLVLAQGNLAEVLLHRNLLVEARALLDDLDARIGDQDSEDTAELRVRQAELAVRQRRPDARTATRRAVEASDGHPDLAARALALSAVVAARQADGPTARAAIAEAERSCATSRTRGFAADTRLWLASALGLLGAPEEARAQLDHVDAEATRWRDDAQARRVRLLRMQLDPRAASEDFEMPVFVTESLDHVAPQPTWNGEDL